MQRSRLKNIINKSKEILNKPVGEPFDEFKNSLPKELVVGDNYRLEAAWKAYGSPKDYKAALWEGMIQPINENEFKLPSIGYNEETDEYEYLNKGRENDTVAKDIRVWDNDVIPFVQELKHGGYVRKFNEEKDCWTYTKNSQKENALGENNSSVSQETGGELIDWMKKGNKVKKIKSDKSYYDPENNTIYYTDKEALKHELFHLDPDEELLDYLRPYYENLNDEKIQNFGGDLTFVKRFENDPNHFYSPEELGARVVAANYRIRNKRDATGYSPDFFKNIRENESQYGDNMRDLLHMYNDENLSKIFNYYNRNGFGGETNLYIDKTGEFAGGNPIRFKGKINGVETYESLDGKDEYVAPSHPLEQFKQGGQMNVIPEGALHARKNNMEGAGEDFTAKGIPVVDNNGEQQAEIEKNEVIFNKDLTDFIENNLKKFNSEETSNSEKDEIAIKVGKRLVKELLTNTDDRTGLISEVEQKV